MDFDTYNSTALVTVDAPSAGPLDALRDITAADRLRYWLRSLGQHTARGYARDLYVFGLYLKQPTAEAAIEIMCHLSRSRALLVAEGWRDSMVEAKLSSATVNRRLAALNGALREIAKADIGPGRLDIKGVKAEPRRNTEGPQTASLAIAVRELGKEIDPGSRRDLSIILLAGKRGLRRNEIATLRMCDLDLASHKISVLRKGNRERVAIQICEEVCAAIESWLALRPHFVLQTGEEAVFVALRGVSRGRAMSGQAIWAVARSVGEQIGEGGSRWRAHGLRHHAITSALAASSGNLVAACAFAGHQNVATTQRYVDEKGKLVAGIIGALPSLGGDR